MNEIKTFSKKKHPNRVYFTPDMKIRSYAYGKEVHETTVKWVERFSREWNRPGQNFLLLESGSLGNIPAKFNAGESIHLDQPNDKEMITFSAQPKILHRLWFDNMLMEVDRSGKLKVNGCDTGFSPGIELKAWGCDILWDTRGNPTYYLFVVGKQSGSSDCSLHAYLMKKGEKPTFDWVTSKKLPSTLYARSNLYCFGNHIFLIHNAQLEYFHFRPEACALDEVAIATDESNQEKECCRQVVAPVILDSSGYVYWQAGNNVHSFPMGYPRRITTVCADEQYEIKRIQCYKDSLFIYRYNRYNQKYTCMRYDRAEDGELYGRDFNNDAAKNVIYHENNGALYYVKIPNNSFKAYIAMRKDQTETILSYFVIDDKTQVFCAGGSLYIGCDYVGKRPQNQF